MHKLLILAAGIIFLAVGSFFSGYYFHQQIQAPAVTEVRDKDFQYISPLLECATAESKSLGKFKQSLQKDVDNELSKEDIMQISIYFKNLQTNQWFTIHNDERYMPASLLKLQLLMAILKNAENDPKLLTTTFLYNGQYQDLKNLPSGLNLEEGVAYTYNQLLRHMIVESDNISYQILKDAFYDENRQIQHFFGLRTGEDTQIEINPYEYSRALNALYSATYLDKEMSEKALSLLVDVSFDDGISGTIPENISVANKYGFKSQDINGEVQLHDCGIVYHPTQPYLLCVMTKGKDVNSLSAAISNISKLIFEEINSH